MATGLLVVTGQIDLNQFWNIGMSDADTVKVAVDAEAGAFQFRPNPDAEFKVTHAFDDATVVGRQQKAVIDEKGRLTIRLQGIDAPELHYRPEALLKKIDRTEEQQRLYLEWNLEYRQTYAETATIALHQLLEEASQNPLPCQVFTAVDKPDDVFDTYGRFIGDIVIELAGTSVNLNQWLTEQGLAVPTFYESMSQDEINTLKDLAEQAKAEKRGLWKHFKQTIIPFDWEMVFRGKGQPFDPSEDTGSVILPKLFRRQATYQVNERAQMFAGSFPDFLKKSADEIYLLSEFLEAGKSAQERYLHDRISNNRLQEKPWELVFQEANSHLKPKAGKPIDW
jgi:endonuclease YncB( thermonuclease family)